MYKMFGLKAETNAYTFTLLAFTSALSFGRILGRCSGLLLLLELSFELLSVYGNFPGAPADLLAKRKLTRLALFFGCFGTIVSVVWCPFPVLSKCLFGCPTLRRLEEEWRLEMSLGDLRFLFEAWKYFKNILRIAAFIKTHQDPLIKNAKLTSVCFKGNSDHSPSESSSSARYKEKSQRVIEMQSSFLTQWMEFQGIPACWVSVDIRADDESTLQRLLWSLVAGSLTRFNLKDTGWPLAWSVGDLWGRSVGGASRRDHLSFGIGASETSVTLSNTGGGGSLEREEAHQKTREAPMNKEIMSPVRKFYLVATILFGFTDLWGDLFFRFAFFLRKRFEWGLPLWLPELL